MSYTIRQVATQFHMQPSTLRYYEDQGLLTNVERTETGQRIYEDCHIDRLRAICCFKNAGMTIDDLKKFWPCAVWCGWVCQVVTVLRSSLPQVR